MALPRTLKHFNVFINGVSFIGVIPSLTLPKLGRKMEEYRGGGMEGAVKVDMGQQPLELEFDSGFDTSLFEQYGQSKADAVLLRFAGSYQRDDTGEIDAVEITVRGRLEEIDMGSAKAGGTSSLKTKMPLSYYKLSVNNKDIVEIDLANFISKVGGTDRLADHRKALGI